jgi:predicted dehydrogenase
VDLALWALDFPEVTRVTSNLYAGGQPLTNPGQVVEDYAVAQLELKGGVAVQLACSWKVSAGCDAVIEASFYGSKGGASFRNVNGSFYDFTAELFHGTSRQRLSEPPDAWGGRAAVDWATRLAEGARFDPEAERLVVVAEALDRIYRPQA